MTIPGHPPFFLKPQPRFVTMRGGEYLFRPSMSALRWLAGRAARARSPRRPGSVTATTTVPCICGCTMQ